MKFWKKNTEQRRTEPTLSEYVEQLKIFDKLLFVLYSSGSFTPESKMGRVMATDASHTFPDFLKIEFDGRFFGPISSQIEDNLQEAFEGGYVDEANYTRGSEPIHLSRTLLPSGRKRARAVAADHKSYGIDNLEKFIARQLAISSLPSDLVVSLGMYYSYSNKSPLFLEESRGLSNRLPFAANKKSIYAVVEEIKKCEGAIVQIRELEEFQNKCVISYVINKDKVKNRYTYLDFNKKNVEFNKKRFAEIENNTNEEQIINNCCYDLHDDDASLKRYYVAELLDEYPGIINHYANEAKDVLRIIDQNDKLIEDGYQHVFNIHKKIAELSENNYLKNIIETDGTFTTSRLFVPMAIKESIKQDIRGNNKVWHSGLDMYVQHIPQFLERFYLKQQNYNTQAIFQSLLPD